MGRPAVRETSVVSAALWPGRAGGGGTHSGSFSFFSFFSFFDFFSLPMVKNLQVPTRTDGGELAAQIKGITADPSSSPIRILMTHLELSSTNPQKTLKSGNNKSK